MRWDIRSVAGDALLGPITALLHVQTDVRQQAVGGVHAQFPTSVWLVVAAENAQQFQHAVAVDGVDLLGQLDPSVAAVAFDLAMVGVEHDAPNCAVVEAWGQRIGKCGQGVLAQRAGLTMQPES